MTLEEMQAVDIRIVDRDTLVDIRDVCIDETLPRDERFRSFLKQIKNPFVFKCGNIVIKTTYAKNGVTMEDCLVQYFKDMQ